MHRLGIRRSLQTSLTTGNCGGRTRRMLTSTSSLARITSLSIALSSPARCLARDRIGPSSTLCRPVSTFSMRRVSFRRVSQSASSEMTQRRRASQLKCGATTSSSTDRSRMILSSSGQTSLQRTTMNSSLMSVTSFSARSSSSTLSSTRYEGRESGQPIAFNPPPLCRKYPLRICR